MTNESADVTLGSPPLAETPAVPMDAFGTVGVASNPLVLELEDLL